MAGSPSAPSQPCHVRSISLPSRSHPVTLRVEEDLHKLRTYITTRSSTPEMMQDALRELSASYESMEELLLLPSSISSSENRWLEKELDESVKLLDLCCAVKDSFTTMKEHIEDIQLALRRRENAAIERKVNAYVRSTKKADKNIQNCLRSLKQVYSKYIDTDTDLETRAKFLKEVKIITVSLLQLVSSLFATQTQREKTIRWSFVAMALRRRKGADEEHEINFFSSFECILSKDVDEERVQKVQNQLEALEICTKGIETGLESLFRQMIHSRVTLLNILSS